MKKVALIFGVTGQDGSYMAELLLAKGYDVHGVVRHNADQKKIIWIKSLIPSIQLHYVNILEKYEIFNVIRISKPSEVYNFAGSTNVFNAWEDLDSVFNLNARMPVHIMDSIVSLDKSIKFFQASSCLIFGKDASGSQNEQTPTNPIHPYGAAKLFADNMLREFRSEFAVYFCSGIMFNHESERRGDMFFSKKIIKAAVHTKLGKQSVVKIGNLNSFRDYGYAPDYMKAVCLMMNNSEPKDYVIGTGELISMREFVKKAFDYVGLDYMNHVKFDESLDRKNDTNILRADTSKIVTELGWAPLTSIDKMIKIMIDAHNTDIII